MDIEVKESKIEGKGVFAVRDFKKGEVVIDWSTCSDVLTKEQMENMPAHKKRYVSYLSKGKYVFFKSPGKYVNHSCDSNTKSLNGCDVAVKNIKKGEEITADYVREKVPGLNMECKCGSEKCRGTIKINS